MTTTRTLIAWCSIALGACAQLPGPAATTAATSNGLAAPATTASPATPGAPTVQAPASKPQTSPQAEAPAQPVAVAAAAPVTVPAAGNDAATDEGRNAAGTPTDPLEPEKPVALDSADAQADLWRRIRGGFSMPALDNDLVRDHEQWYARRPDYVQRMTERGGRYLYHIVEEVQKRGMPAELALLPFIESAFNPQAMSSARASGMWQFMPATGRDFELRQNVFRDDRRDVLASTRAALDYLGRLYGQFGDWHLALAAYNWGEGNVQKAITRNQRAGKPTDYASLNMPMETRHYVPKLEAVKNIVADPVRFGLALPELHNHPYFLGVPIQRDIDVELAARLAGLRVEEFKTLNPQMNKPVILAAGTPQVLLPYDNADRFVRNLGAHRGPLASWTAWVVPRTMRPGDAAEQAGMSEGVLREINHIPPRMLVKAGSTLLVPRSARRDEDVSEHLADNASIALAPDAPALKRLNVKARKGETLAGVAQRYRVSTAQLAQWNRLTAASKIAAGTSLVVYVAPANKTVARSSGRASHAPSVARADKSAKPVVRMAKAAGKSVKPAGRSTRRVASTGTRLADN